MPKPPITLAFSTNFFFRKLDQDMPSNMLQTLTTFSQPIKYVRIQFRTVPDMSVLMCTGWHPFSPEETESQQGDT